MTEEEFTQAVDAIQERFQQDDLSEEEMQLLQRELNDLYCSFGLSSTGFLPFPRGMGLRQRLRSRSPVVRGKESSIDRVVQRYLAR